MSCFDEDPRDARPAYACPECDTGTVSEDSPGVWSCDSCDFKATSKGAEGLGAS